MKFYNKMLLKHFLLLLLFNLFLNVRAEGVNIFQRLKNAINLVDNTLQITPYINITIGGVPPNCVQMVCKFVCFNGKSTEIDLDILIVSQRNKFYCSTIEELRLYNYEFPDNKISYGFLGNCSETVNKLYIASANVTAVEGSAFAKGSFKEIYFENLQLTELNKDLFEGISGDLSLFSIVQKETPLQTVYSDFLCYVKYQLKSLTVQAGLGSICNLTAGDYLLNSLIYADFSYNNFGTNMAYYDFNRVSMIEHIDLSHSNLEYLPEYIFADFTSSLEFLDLSYNKLKTLSRTIFGWREVPRDLKIYANENEWWCSCDLQKELKNIFVYNRVTLMCAAPSWYANWSVFDEEICGVSSLEGFVSTASIQDTTTATSGGSQGSIKDPIETETDKPFSKGTTLMVSSTTEFLPKPGLKPDNDLKQILTCLAGPNDSSERIDLPVQWPLLLFSVTPQESLRVNVLVSSPATLSNALGLIWFSKVTTEYYKMEINYNEYGLGCFKAISFVTTVDNLLPNTAYTFCVVQKNQVSTSPFSCKSIHIEGNIAVKHSAWLTRDMRVTGCSLVVFGIVMFSFAGILIIYLILKQKPTLLKGSKRVTTLHGKSNEIVVFPDENSVHMFQEKEEKLARQGPFSCSEKRRKSIESIVSYQSYINANLYEVIPAHSRFNSINHSTLFSSSSPPEIKTDQDNKHPDTEDCYLTPLETLSEAESCYLMPLEAVPEADACYMTPLGTVTESETCYLTTVCDEESCYLTPLENATGSADLTKYLTPLRNPFKSEEVVKYAEIPYRAKRNSNDALPEVPPPEQTSSLSLALSESLDKSLYSQVGAFYVLDSQF